jgi:hypothetical protein
LLEAGSSYLTILLWDRIAGQADAIEHFTGIVDWEEDWELMLQQSALLNYKGLGVTLLVNTARCMPMPQVFFNQVNAKDQLAALFGETGNFYGAADVLDNHDMVICWEVSPEIYRCISNHFMVIQAQSLGAAMVQSGWNQNAVGPYGVFLVTHENAVITAWRGQQFLILKTISIDVPDDLAYQLLNICKQWGIENNKMYWEVSGIVSTDSPRWQIPSQFFDNFNLANTGTAISPEIPEQYFAHLIHFMRSV